MTYVWAVTLGRFEEATDGWSCPSEADAHKIAKKYIKDHPHLHPSQYPQILKIPNLLTNIFRFTPPQNHPADQDPMDFT